MTQTMRGRAICALTLVVGAAVLAWSLAIEPGDPAFYLATGVLALVWLVGALAARRALGKPLRRVVPADRSARRDALLGVAVGVSLAVIFLVGAGLVTLVPSLRTPVEELLDHASEGMVALVFVLTMVNGYAEELFFRGSLFDALGPIAPVLTTTLVYTIVVACSGIWLLALAGVFVGGTAAWLRVRTGGTTAAIIAHLIWASTMLFLLPPAFALWS